MLSFNGFTVNFMAELMITLSIAVNDPSGELWDCRWGDSQFEIFERDHSKLSRTVELLTLTALGRLSSNSILVSLLVFIFTSSSELMVASAFCLRVG